MPDEPNAPETGDHAQNAPAAPANLIQVDEIPGPDFTALFDRTELYPPGYDPAEEGAAPPSTDAEKSEQEKPAQTTPTYSYAYTATVAKGATSTDARVLACRAYKKMAWSLTMRSNVAAPEEKEPAAPKEAQEESFRKRLAAELPSLLENPPLAEPGDDQQIESFKVKHCYGYCPSGYQAYSQKLGERIEPKPTNPLFFNSMFEICSRLHKTIFHTKKARTHSDKPVVEQASNEREHAEGLIVVTGATESSKSLITRGLIFLLMQEAAMKAHAAGTRRPHLLTYEDPIEKYYAIDGSTDKPPRSVASTRKLLDAMHLDYTPRQKGVDVGSLREACKDALRQTPEIFFVGETREAKDWAELMRFANTGHLVITTAHANSVVEALGAILRATCADTPSRRSEMCRRIKAVVHIRTLNLGDNRPYVRTLIPALWLKTPASVNSITADGLASVLPSLGGEKTLGYFGRTFFAKKLIKAHKKAYKEAQEKVPPGGTRVRKPGLKDLRKHALRWDLTGV